MPALADQRRQIDVPAGELIDALKALTQQSGVDLVYRSEQLAGLSTQGLSGVFSPQEAVTRLLEGTALTVKTDSSGAMLIALPRSAPTSGSTLGPAPKVPSAGAPLSAAATAKSRQTSVQQPAARSVDATSDRALVNESASPADYLRAGTDLQGALGRVKAARSRAGADPLALEEALTALGDAFLGASEYAKAEAPYNEALQLAERHGGLESERVLAPLLGLGKILVASGHNQEAVPQLQRALAIERSQYGVFDLRQQDTLKLLAASLTALDRVPEARDLMLYRVRVAEKTFGEGNPRVIPMLCELGDWFAENLLSLDARMTFQMALNIVGAMDSSNDDPIIVEPLRGIARTRMRAQSYPSERWVQSPLRPHESPVQRYTSLGVPLPGPADFNREGEQALQRALRILDADPSASTPATRIETLIQLGDWYQIKKSPGEALPYYQRAWQLMRSSPGLPDSVTTALDVPVRVYYPTPPIVTYVPVVPPEDTRFHHVEVEFTVLADGSVRDARMVKHDTRERYARDIFSAVSHSRFRPKFVDGQAVAATGITYREVFWTGKPRD